MSDTKIKIWHYFGRSRESLLRERGVNARKERQHAIADKAAREKTKREFGLTDSPPPTES